MKKTTRGITLAEILLASAFLLVITSIIFSAWIKSASAWKSASQRSTTDSGLHILLRRMDRLLTSTSLDTVEFSATPTPCLACASAYPVRSSTSTQYSINPTGYGLIWQKYVLFYLDNSSNKVMYKEIAIPTSASARTIPTPLTQADLGFGLKPLSYYCNGGETQALNVVGLSVGIEGRIINIDLSVQATSTAPISHNTWTIYVRN